MAYALKNEEKYYRAKKEAEATGGDIVEIYKKIGGAFVEGTNEEIERTQKVIGIFDKVKDKKPTKKSKKLGSVKKKK